MTIPNVTLEGGKGAGERIAKVIARSGICSRREAEVLIGDRRVSVNGNVIESAALDIRPSDTVLVDGKPLPAREPPRLWRYYKPKGRVTSHKDPEGRPTVFEALPEGLPRLISVGRLDFNTEGLLLLTNDGDLARHLELPSTGWTRRYRVRAYGRIGDEQLKELAGGLTINKVSYGPIEASLEREQGDNVWISVAIREGKNREVRRIMEHLELTVNRLIRVSFGPFMLGDLEPGQIEEVKTSVLKDQLGPRLSRQLGVRREIPREERRLAPARAKPTYLRRKPANEERPTRPEPEARPLKRRRILKEGGMEAPAIEFVPERKPRAGRFTRDTGGSGKPRSRAEGAGREARAPRFENETGDRFKSRPSLSREAGKPREAEGTRPWRERDSAERRAGTSREAGKPREAEGARPWRERDSAERRAGTSREAGKPREAEGARPWRERDGAERRAGTSREAGRPREAEGARPWRERDGAERRAGTSREAGKPREAEGARPWRERDSAERRAGTSREAGRPREAEGARPWRERDSRPVSGAEPQTAKRRDHGRARFVKHKDAANGASAPREYRPDETRAARRPPRHFEGERPGEAPQRRPREDRAEGAPRASFRRAAEGEAKPFKMRRAGGPPRSRSGADTSQTRRGEGKPLRGGGKAAHTKHRAGPRKPKPVRREETP